ncbi:MAG TPA: cobalamin-dependent protein [Polyangiaceae bacterium]|nr:cobalamin-dependent protein [Polyangiaceae bacterium]
MAHVSLVGPEIEENLSLRYLASSLARAGHTSDLVPFNQAGDFAYALEAVLAKAPLVVGISLAFQWRANDFLAFAVALRERGYQGHIAFGGHFATFATKELLVDFPEITSIVRQESEETFAALTSALANGEDWRALPGLAYRDERGVPILTAEAALPDLAQLPYPDRRGEPAACFGHGIAPLVASRGCYANCSFCCIAAWHEQSLPGKRYRLRDVEAVADEMVSMKRERGVDVFVFHDDNFFLPGHKKNFERLSSLADALQKRDIGPFATVVKARPTDVSDEVFSVLKHRLGCIRAYIGIETDADQGLETLRRWSHAKQNKKSIDTVRRLDLYTCFNMLIFDPDTDLDALTTNIAFLRYAPEFPSNFGRVELYAGTPLLHRMKQEGRVRGDYMQWDYSLATPEVERVFDLTMRCFYERNFGNDALSNRIMGTRFDVEIVKHFHPEVHRAAWSEEGKELSRILTLSGADALERIVEHVRRGAPATEDTPLVDELAAGLRDAESRIRGRARALAIELSGAVGRGKPLTEIGDVVATPLQTQRSAPAA